MCFPTQLDVGVDAHNYTPISWKEVDSIIQEQISNNKNQFQTLKDALEKV